VNPRLSEQEVQSCLSLLEHVLVSIRGACWSEEFDKAEALADAVHNLPRLLLGMYESLTLEGFESAFLEGLIETYPEFAGLRHILRPVRTAE
jgi:hypothetical protein